MNYQKNAHCKVTSLKKLRRIDRQIDSKIQLTILFRFVLRSKCEAPTFKTWAKDIEVVLSLPFVLLIKKHLKKCQELKFHF